MKDYKIKILLLGDSRTGKTSFLKKYIYDMFPNIYKETLSIEYGESHYIVDNKNLFLEIWDVTGKELHGFYNRIYYKFANIAIIFFDVTNQDTLEIANKWKADVEDKLGTIPCILVANKIDLPNHIINEFELKVFSDKNGYLTFFLISVKNNIGVGSVMKFIMENCLDLPEYFSITENKQVSIEKPSGLKSKCCLQ